MHLLGAAIYTIDLLRMYSHPHSWVFDAPVIAWYMCDRIYGIFWYRRCTAVVVKKLQFDEDYMVLFLRVPHKVERRIGDVMYFNVLDCGWDRAHPFSVFSNHTGSAAIATDLDAKFGVFCLRFQLKLCLKLKIISVYVCDDVVNFVFFMQSGLDGS